MSQFSEEQIKYVWNSIKSNFFAFDTSMKQDVHGAWMKFEHYGNRNSEFGWEIDHIRPIHGNDDFESIENHPEKDNVINLRPLHWENNVKKGDDYPKYQIAMSSDSYEGKSKNVDVSEKGKFGNVKKEKVIELKELFG